MQRMILLFLFITIFFSCKKEGSAGDPTANTINRSLIIGWWNSDLTKNGGGEYYRRYWGNDSTMRIDRGTVPGIVNAKWWWQNKDTFYVVGGGESRCVVKKLTADSMIVEWIDFSRTLYYYR
jgi:hypothetical protein